MDGDFEIEIFFLLFFCLGPIFMFSWMANKKFLTSADVIFLEPEDFIAGT